VDAKDEAFLVERAIATSAATGQFTVTRIAGLADTVFSYQYAYRPRPFDQNAADAVIETAVTTYSRIPGVDREALAAAFRRDFVPPAFHPPVQQARAGEDGALWLLLHDDGGASRRWLLLDSRGDARGIVALPRETTVMWSNGSVLWAVQPDELDVPWLLRYRVRMAP
jgi:hypothetical protein